MILCQLSVLLTLLLTINHCLTDIPPDQSDIPPGTPDQTDTSPATPNQSYIPPDNPELNDHSFDALESDHIPEGFFDIRSLGIPLGSRIGADDYKGICLNGGTLIASDSEFVFSCSCLPGFSGQRCPTDDCRNDGKPLAYERGADGGLKCICPAGFGGDRCQAETEECHNGGKWKWNEMCAYCDCPAPFVGRRCAYGLDIPLGSRIGADDYKGICLNGGTLIVSDSEFVISCSCLPGFSGQRCQTDDCRNGGKPLAYERGADGGLRCICPAGFGGDRCQADTEECHNGGKCKWNEMSAYCDCPARFFGRRCAYECPAGFTLVTTAEGLKVACYKPLLTSTDWWTHAKTCSSFSPLAHLAFVRTKQENDRLVSFIKSDQFNSCQFYRSIFTGGQRRRHGVCTDEFVWKNGDKLVDKVTFTNWRPNEPNCDHGGIESCLTYWTDYMWNDLDCHSSICGVCEVSGF